MKVKKALQGKKTYLVCASTILGIIIAWLSDKVELAEMVQTIVIALIGIFLKVGESRIEKKVSPEE